MEKEAVGVRDLGGALEREAPDHTLLRPDEPWVGVLADLLRQAPQPLDSSEGLGRALLANNRAQARGEKTDFMANRFVHCGDARLEPRPLSL